MMKTGYIRFDDAVYQKVPYIENFGYASFTIENHEKIVEIYWYPLDERYRELYEMDEALTSHHMDDVPALETVEFLPPSEGSRFSMLIGYANGEMRRYDAPGNLGNEEVVQWRGHAFTDEIFRSGRISGDLHADKDWLLRCYPVPYSGVGFSNGAGISAVELYHASYPVSEFEYRDGAEILVSQECADDEPFCVGRIRDMDPANPLYLFDRKRKIAKTLPAQYQETPVGVVPFCGGYSEGLIMVSAMGNADFQYRRAGYPCAGMWGWLNTELQTVIEPKYIYATNFRNGRAIVCKGEWSAAETNGGLQYWSENEGWGVIDRQEREIVPCRFDALYEIDGADRLYFVHEGGWENGRYAVYDAQGQNTLLKLDCSFNPEHRFNKLFVTDDDVLVFIACLPGADEDLVYAYDLQKREYIAYAVSDIGRALNGGSKAVIEKDGYYRILTARRTADVLAEGSADSEQT